MGNSGLLPRKMSPLTGFLDSRLTILYSLTAKCVTLKSAVLFAKVRSTFRASGFTKSAVPFIGKTKGSPAMGEPQTTGYGTDSVIDYHRLRLIGRVGFEPTRSITPTDFKSVASAVPPPPPRGIVLPPPGRRKGSFLTWTRRDLGQHPAVGQALPAYLVAIVAHNEHPRIAVLHRAIRP